jgi:hypothetical protein
MKFIRRYKKILLILALLAFSALIAWLLWLPVISPEDRPPEIDDELWDFISTLPEAEQREILQIIGEPGWLQSLPEPDRVVDPFRPDDDSAIFEEPDLIASGGITKTDLVIQKPTFRPTMNSQNNLSFFDLRDNKFYRLDEAGNLVNLSERSFPNTVDVTWAPEGNKAVIKNVNGSKIIYNFDTQKQVSLPNHWDDFSFSPDGNQLTGKSIGNDSSNRWLITFDDTGSNAKTLENLGNNHDKVYPNWSPNNQMVAMWTRGIDFNRQNVFFVGQHGENFKSTVIEGRGFQPKWSETGERLLYSVYSSDTDMNPNLWVVKAEADSIGQERTNLNLATWAEKCSFIGNSDIYCAVPENLPAGAGLIPEIAKNSADNLYHINLSTGEKNLIAIPEKAVNISQVMVNSQQDILYFTDNTTGQLYSINLK